MPSTVCLHPSGLVAINDNTKTTMQLFYLRTAPNVTIEIDKCIIVTNPYTERPPECQYYASSGWFGGWQCNLPKRCGNVISYPVLTSYFSSTILCLGVMAVPPYQGNIKDTGLVRLCNFTSNFEQFSTLQYHLMWDGSDWSLIQDDYTDYLIQYLPSTEAFLIWHQNVYAEPKCLPAFPPTYARMLKPINIGPRLYANRSGVQSSIVHERMPQIYVGKPIDNQFVTTQPPIAYPYKVQSQCYFSETPLSLPTLCPLSRRMSCDEMVIPYKTTIPVLDMLADICIIIFSSIFHSIYRILIDVLVYASDFIFTLLTPPHLLIFLVTYIKTGNPFLSLTLAVLSPLAIILLENLIT